MNRNIVIIGGVAGGMATAARLRRLSENDNITVIERGKYISFANCGMPYYLGDVIDERSKLFVKTPQEMSKLFNLNIKTQTEALKINKESKTVTIKNLLSEEVSDIPYDKLILSTGAEPFIPPIAGIDLPNILKLRNLEDMDKIKTIIENNATKNAVVIGGGFIGLEMAENLKEKGLEVSIVELDKQVMTIVDPEMATAIHHTLLFNDIKLYLNNSVESFESYKNHLRLKLTSNNFIETDLVLVCIGVNPETKLAKEAGLELGIKESIVVNNKLETSDPDILAVGDAVQVKDFVNNSPVLIPLAGPANRQGRIVAENLAGMNKVYKNTLGTSICKVFDLTVATTGLNEKILKRNNIPYLKTYIHPNDHASYYPKACPLTLKLLFAPETGKILGAQITGYDGVDKRIDVIATAIRSDLTVYDLEYLELAYAPPYNSVKDPVNVAGNVASNILNNIVKTINPEDIETLDREKAILLDVSTVEEYKISTIEGSICIPIGELRSRLNELDKSKEIIVFCQKGLRGYLGYRTLIGNSFKARNLSGGVEMYKAYKESTQVTSDPTKLPFNIGKTTCYCNQQEKKTVIPTIEIDACGLQCPGPIMQLKENIEKIQSGNIVKITAMDSGFAADVMAWCNATGNKLLDLSRESGKITAIIEKMTKLNTENNNDLNNINSQAKDKTIVVFSNDLDKALAAFIIANGAASMGDKVTLFFTFWGLNILRKENFTSKQKTFLDKMFGFMMPKGANKLTLSKMNMFGMGTVMMKYVMKNKNVLSLGKLMALAKKNGVRLVACTMSMDVMGLKKEELIDGIEEAGVAGYIDSANRSNLNLFI